MRRNDHERQGASKARVFSFWFNQRSPQSVDERTTEASPVSRRSSGSLPRSRMDSGRSASSVSSVSKQKLGRLMRSIKGREKPLRGRLPWQMFVEEEHQIKFGGRWPDHFQKRTATRSPAEFEMGTATWREQKYASWTDSEATKIMDLEPCKSAGDDSTPTTEWHKAISENDWGKVQAMLDEALQKEDPPSESEESNNNNETPAAGMKKTGNEPNINNAFFVHLTTTDIRGYTPLHLACVVKMPSKLTQQLFSLGKDAALIKDKDGRLPLHLAALYHQSPGVMDRLIRSNPGTLAFPDSFGHSPLRYALFEAEQKRNKSFASMDWKPPVTHQQSLWQSAQTANWSNLHLLLKMMIRRKKLLFYPNDQALVLESIHCLAPPEVAISMLTVGAKVVASETTAIVLLCLLFRFNYPNDVVESALRICSCSIPKKRLIGFFRQSLSRHFDEGCKEIYREMSQTKVSFRDEILESSSATVLDDACRIWWDRLKFFVKASSYYSLSYDRSFRIPQEQLVHAALRIPDVAPSLIEFLLRGLQPAYSGVIQPDIRSGALPVHLACKHTKHASIAKRMQIFKCTLDCGHDLRRIEYRGRVPLHWALLAGQPLPVLQAMIGLDARTAGWRDPLTRLFPFQLAACFSHLVDRSSDKEEEDNDKNAENGSFSGDGVWSTLDASFELLRACPIAVLPQLFMGSGCDLKGCISPISRHVVNLCYDYETSKGWIFRDDRVRRLREFVLSKEDAAAGCETDEVSMNWWARARQLIWHLYSIRWTKQKTKLELGDNRYLLHAALSVGATPPLLISLILQQNEGSANNVLPGTNAYPVHLAARSVPYVPLPFEVDGRNRDSLPEATAFGLTTRCTTADILDRLAGGKAPLELALATGKTWEDVQRLVESHPRCLVRQDPKSGDYPFQLAACKESYAAKRKIVRSRSILHKWNTDPSSGAENGSKLKSYWREYKLEKLTTVFEILRAKPAVILSAARYIRQNSCN